MKTLEPITNIVNSNTLLTYLPNLVKIRPQGFVENALNISFVTFVCVYFPLGRACSFYIYYHV